MKKVVVTGAGGFIGHNLAHYLHDRGYVVSGVDIHAPQFPVYKNPDDRFRFISGDFRDPVMMQNLCRDADAIIHLASAHLQTSLDDSEYWAVNVHSLQPFMKLAQESGVKRFIHVSSVGTYGNLAEWPADEDSETRPQSIYGETKLAGEKQVAEFGSKYDFDIVILRPAWVYGKGCPRTLKLYRALKKRQFVMIGNGENMRHPIYIDDAAEAMRLAMEEDNAVGKLILLGGESAVTTNELIDSFCDILNLPAPVVRIPYWAGRIIAATLQAGFGLIRKEPPISRRTLEFFDTNNSFDITRSKEILKFAPSFSLRDGLADSRDWLMKHG
jgi:nucleoside-diphosphate-sugar epimerase